MDPTQMLGSVRMSLQKKSGKHQLMQAVGRTVVLPHTAAGEAIMQ